MKLIFQEGETLRHFHHHDIESGRYWIETRQEFYDRRIQATPPEILTGCGVSKVRIGKCRRTEMRQSGRQRAPTVIDDQHSACCGLAAILELLNKEFVRSVPGLECF